MERLFHRVWSAVGSAIIIVITCVLIVMVRILKAFVAERSRPLPDGDIFTDSRKRPLPLNLKKQG